MTLKRLESGYLHLRLGWMCWAQFPEGLRGTIPDEYIFQPEWSRDRINSVWKRLEKRYVADPALYTAHLRVRRDMTDRLLKALDDN